MSETSTRTDRFTHEEWLTELRRRFGDSPMAWSFVCPNCGDVASGLDFRTALAEHPRTRGGNPVTASDILGQECIGRTVGESRGCDWAAYGLICGPVLIEVGDKTMFAFRMAEATS